MPPPVYAPPAVFRVISLLLGSVTLLSSRERLWLRVMAFCAFLAALPMLWQTSLGLPRPAHRDLRKRPGTVVSYVVDEPKPILIWLVPDGSNLPRAYSVSFETKKALQQAYADARHQGNAVRMEPGGAGGKSANPTEARGNPGGSRSDASSSIDRSSGGPDFYPAPQLGGSSEGRHPRITGA